MKVTRSQDLTPLTMPGSETEKLWLYNGLDCCVTFEVLEQIETQLDNQTRATYEFSKSLQAPVFEMKIRGIRVDLEERDRVIHAYTQTIERVAGQLHRILSEGIGLDINWKSPQQLQNLFYTVLGIPPVTHQGKITVNRGALERLSGYFLAEPIVNHILVLRDLAKKVSTLKTEIDPDGRMRTSYNIAGTTTGRFSSSLSDFGTGGNLQNWEELLRRIFIADPGMKFAYIDLEQAESRAVGAIEWNLFHDGLYLDACESGDLHTAVSKMAWPNLKWTGNLSLDKGIAEQPFYRQHSHRHMAKILGHGTNYRGTPRTMAKHTKIDSKIIAEFQSVYFRGFPAHQRWHGAVASTLLSEGNLTSLTGRRRWFFGRRDDDATIREAVAFDPQGSVGDILNTGMLRVWRSNLCQLLLQVHDAIVVQYPEEKEDEILPQLLKIIQVPVELNHGRTLLIPSEAKVGWNWASATEENIDGLIKYKGAGADGRRRQKPATQVGIMDRRFL